MIHPCGRHDSFICAACDMTQSKPYTIPSTQTLNFPQNLSNLGGLGVSSLNISHIFHELFEELLACLGADFLASLAADLHVVLHRTHPLSAEDLLAVRRSDETLEVDLALNQLGRAGDGGLAGAVEGGQEGSLAVRRSWCRGG